MGICHCDYWVVEWIAGCHLTVKCTFCPCPTTFLENMPFNFTTKRDVSMIVVLGIWMNGGNAVMDKHGWIVYVYTADQRFCLSCAHLCIHSLLTTCTQAASMKYFVYFMKSLLFQTPSRLLLQFSWKWNQIIFTPCWQKVQELKSNSSRFVKAFF